MLLDDKVTIKMDAETAAKEGLKIGQELSSEELSELVKNINATRCLNTAYRYLGYRPRSEAELKERLRLRGFENNQIEIVINKLKEQNLLDDTAFARFWKENRDTFRPISKYMTRQELIKKGVASAVIDEVTADADDDAAAYHAAVTKAARLPRQDYDIFCRRLGDFLKRRGFGYQVVNRTVKKVWQESEQS